MDKMKKGGKSFDDEVLNITEYWYLFSNSIIYYE
jgi:hypothetical protein